MVTISRDSAKDFIEKAKREGKSSQQIMDAFKSLGISIGDSPISPSSVNTQQVTNDASKAKAVTQSGKPVGKNIDAGISSGGAASKMSGGASEVKTPPTTTAASPSPIEGGGVTPTQQQFSPTQQKRNVDMLKKMYENRVGRLGEDAAKDAITKAAQRLNINPDDIFTETMGTIDFSEVSDQDVGDKLNEVVDARANTLTGDIKTQDDAISFVTGETNVLTNILQGYADQITSQIDELKSLTDQSNQNIAQIAEKRLELARDSAEDIKGELDILRDKAMSVFDENVAASKRERARQLAEAGVLTDAQASQAAQYSLADYTADARLKRAELEQQIQEQAINTIKERDGLIDQIYQQQGVDENTKQQQAAQITGLYNTVLQNTANALAEVRGRYGDQVLELFQPSIEREEQILTPEIQAQISDQEIQQANRSPAARTNFLLRKTNELVDANLSPYLLEYINALQTAGNFMEGDLLDLWSTLVGQARRAYLADNQ